MQRCLLVAVAVGGLMVGPSARAQAVITWGAALTISGEGDVALDGSLVHAFNLGRSSVSAATVGGQNFEAFGIAGTPGSVSVGNFALAESMTALTASNLVGADDGSFVGLLPGYQTLLGSVVYATVENFQTITLSMNGLTDGHRYLFQWWSNDSSFSGHYATTASATNDVTLLSNISDAFGETGQYALGTFTAIGSLQAIDFTGANGYAPRINAFQLRDLGAVPEPSAYAGFAGLAALGFVLVRRRRTRSA